MNARLSLATGWLSCVTAGCVGPSPQAAPSEPSATPAAVESMPERPLAAARQPQTRTAEAGPPLIAGAREAHPQVSTQAKGDSTIDAFQAAVAHGLHATAEWVDGLFGDERFTSEGNRTWVRLRSDGRIEEGESVDTRVRVDARIVLPRTQDKFQLAFSGDLDGELDSEQADDSEAPPVEENQTENDYSTALQYFLTQTEKNSIRLEGGLRFEGLQPSPYVGARWRHLARLGTWQLRFTERLRLYESDGWESKSTMDLERNLGDAFMLRATTRANGYEDGLFYGQDFSLFHRLGAQRLLAYEWLNSFETEPSHVVDEVKLRLRYSQPVTREWIVLEVEPYIAWREVDDYGSTLGLAVRLDLYLGR